jgi:hypothetical protein
MTYCSCKVGAGCFKCSYDKINSAEWPHLVRNRIADELEDLILECKHQYYCVGEPKVSDFLYDKYEDGLKRMRPDSWVLSAVGCPICYKEK